MKRVLVADPDCSLLKTIGILLREEFDISHARNPNAVLQKAGEMQPDVIILGCFAPRGESFALHKKLREQESTASLPILVIDVPPGNHLRKGWKRTEGLQMEAEGYLSRPLDARTLRREVRRVIDSRSAGSLSWAQILEQTERKLLEEVYSWKDVRRRMSIPVKTDEHKPERAQPAALQVLRSE
jgi:PleD family two-component response regulator